MMAKQALQLIPVRSWGVIAGALGLGVVAVAVGCHHIAPELTKGQWTSPYTPRTEEQYGKMKVGPKWVDISTQYSQHVDEFSTVSFDFVVTVCGHADERCPALSGGATILHVPFDDPPKLAASTASEEEALDAYRRVRDEIRAFVETLPEGLRRGPSA